MGERANFVRAMEHPRNRNRIHLENGNLVICHGDGTTEQIRFTENVSLVDKNADGNTRLLYQYMEAVGRSGCVMYGHQNDLWNKAGGKELSFSDTMDATGEFPAVVGMDVLSLAGNEFSAERYNREYAGHGGILEDKVDEKLLGKAYANVVAAAKLADYMQRQGMIITLSAHMPNFSDIRMIEEGKGLAQSYAKYDFNKYTPNVLEGRVVQQVLPGGAYHEIYCAYLDMIADFAELLDGPLLFRPFHENTGSWFWWGEAHCTPEEYKRMFAYTVKYLKDIREIHNLLYVYSPGSEPASPQEFGIRYPGDEYVDMVGFDMYDRMAEKGCDTAFFRDFQGQLDILERFAKAHGKLMAVTETGLAAEKADEGDHMTALHREGNKNRKWYHEVLDAVSKTSASYFLLWANFGKYNSFYTPFVEAIAEDGTRYGHEMLDDYIRYFNDKRSIFSAMQKEITDKLMED